MLAKVRCNAPAMPFSQTGTCVPEDTIPDYRWSSAFYARICALVLLFEMLPLLFQPRAAALSVLLSVCLNNFIFSDLRNICVMCAASSRVFMLR